MPVLKRWNAVEGAWEEVGVTGTYPETVGIADSPTWTGAHKFVAPGSPSGLAPAVHIYEDLTSAAPAGTDANDYMPLAVETNYTATDAATPTDVTYRGNTSILRYGYGGVASLGTVHNWTSWLTVSGSASAGNEFAHSYHAMRFDNGSQGRAWVTDWNLHGPINAQPGLLNGITMFSNNHYNGSPSGGPSGNWIVTKPAQGGGGSAAHTAATTYKLDVGLGIVGYAGTTGSPTRGFEVGLQVGGYGSGWMTSSDSSKVGTGIKLLNIENAAIKIESNDVSGAITWGAAGGAAADTNLYRSAANMLKTDDDFTANTIYAGSGILIGSTTNDVRLKVINTTAGVVTARFRNTGASNAANVLEVQDTAGTTPFVFDANARPKWNAAAMVQTTVGAAGTAAALPSLPKKYLKVVDETGAVLVIPAYTA